ncbi:transglycosylase family protein [Streptomyces sp. NPDC020801]|uniref:transglycosylase family protein n=1 Tax=Streptomyces sp. NPDC020801 TaxID=3365093 RepID=UPI0037ADE979
MPASRAENGLSGHAPYAARRRRARLAALVATSLLGAAASLTAAQQPAAAASVSTWEKVAACESGGNWSISTGNGYYGGLQFSLSTWKAYGGDEFASYPNQATEKEQILVGERVLAGQGEGAWPVCGPRAGLGDDHADPYPTEQPTVFRNDVATRVHGDFNGDGHDDVAAFYGYHDGSTALFTFKGDGRGGFSAPEKSWNVPSGQWTFRNAKFVAGDFNGDGRSDLAAFYGYADGSSAMFTFLANPDGGFSAPVKSWTAGPGQWVFNHVQLASGKFDNSGRDSVAALYGYSDGSAATFTFKTDPKGTFQAPVKSWSVGANQWWGSSSQLVSGDFDGDGTTDLAAFYGYADGRAAMFTFKADGDGGFKAPVKSWNVGPNQWWRGNVQVTAGDFDGDGHDDVAAVYSYADGKVALFTFASDTQGNFKDPIKSWNVPTGQWYTDHAQFAGGKFDASGRDSIAAFYGYSDGSASMFTFPTDTKADFGAPVKSWNVGPNQWWGDNVKLA